MVGEVRPSNRTVLAESPRIVPGAFGEGLSDSVQRYANAAMDYTLSEDEIKNAKETLRAAHFQRQEAIDRSATQVEIIRAKAQLTRDFEDLRKEMPADYNGFTAAVEKKTNETLAAIEAKIPENLRSDFAPDIESFRQEFISASYLTEIAQGDAEYTRKLDEILQLGTNEVLSGGGSYANWADQVEKYLTNSPLDAAKTEALAKLAFARLQKAEFTRVAVEQASAPGADQGKLPGPTTGNDINATGMSGQARGLLNSAAGLRASPNYKTNIQFDLAGKARPNKPDATLTNVLGNTVDEVFGEGYTIVITSGKENDGHQHGSNRHRTGLAADFYIKDANGKIVTSTDPRAQQFLMAAAANGVLGIGYGQEYMGNSFHMDMFPHEWHSANQGPVWGSGASAMKDTLVGAMKSDNEGSYGEADRHPGGEAGRYKITGDAWERARSALGLPDFSAASQDRAAWWLASQLYGSKTNGRSLQADLASANPALVENAREILSEGDLGFQLPALAEMTPEGFYRQVSTSQPTKPGVLYDETFAEVPYDERLAIVQKAQADELTLTTQRQKFADDQRTDFVANLTAQIKLGQASLADIEAANKQWKFDAVEMEKMVSELSAVEQAKVTGQNLATELSSPSFFFNNSKESEKTRADVYSQQAHLPAIQNMDEQAFRGVVSDVSKLFYVPKPVSQQLSLMRASANPQQSEFAYNAMAQLYNANPSVFESGFGQDIMNEVVFWKQSAPYMQPNEATQLLRQRQDPKAFKEITELAQSTLEKDLRENGSDYTADGLLDDFDGYFSSQATVATRAQGNALVSDFKNIVRAQVQIDNDIEAAKDRAREILQSRWGTTNIGTENYFTPRPIESMYQPVAGDYSYVDRDIRKSVGLAEGEAYVAMPDHITEAEIRTGKPPAYQIWKKDANGVLMPIMESQVPGGNKQSLNPARVHFEVDEQARKDHMQQFLTRARQTRQTENKLNEERRTHQDLQNDYEDALQRRGRFADMPDNEWVQEKARLRNELMNRSF